MKPYSKLSEKGQIVLPKEIREVLGVKSGDKVYFLVEDNKVVVKPTSSSMTKMMEGLGKEYWQSIDSAKYLKKERQAWKS